MDASYMIARYIAKMKSVQDARWMEKTFKNRKSKKRKNGKKAHLRAQKR